MDKDNECLKTEIAVLKEKIIQQQDALKLQASEYARRLTDLNGEATRLREMQKTYLARDVYELKHQLLETKIDSLQRFMYLILGGLLVVEIALKYVKF